MEYCINREFLLNKHLYSIYLFCFVQCNFLMQYSMHFHQCKYIVIIFIAISHEPVLYSVLYIYQRNIKIILSFIIFPDIIYFYLCLLYDHHYYNL